MYKKKHLNFDLTHTISIAYSWFEITGIAAFMHQSCCPIEKVWGFMSVTFYVHSNILLKRKKKWCHCFQKEMSVLWFGFIMFGPSLALVIGITDVWSIQVKRKRKCPSCYRCTQCFQNTVWTNCYKAITSCTVHSLILKT